MSIKTGHFVNATSLIKYYYPYTKDMNSTLEAVRDRMERGLVAIGKPEINLLPDETLVVDKDGQWVLTTG